ncbi:sensor histidine kinase [Kitasatospora sp. NPDC090308]|uniref:sensor histidine kinase n=1 Tax=Kitasatospora sp. NPDC090308 TaxID=3364082 RepID=UPI0037F4DB8A
MTEAAAGPGRAHPGPRRETARRAGTALRRRIEQLQLPSPVRESLPTALLLSLLLLHVAATHAPRELPVAAALTTALVLPLRWRRRAPRAVFAAVAAAAGVQWLVGIQLPADAALLVALYAVASHAGRPDRVRPDTAGPDTAGPDTAVRLDTAARRDTLLACAVLTGGALLACLRWTTGGAFQAPFLALTATVVATATLGTNARTGRAYLAVLAERAARLEQQQDQQARLAVAEERTRIAREVHDIVTHNLSVMVALTDAAVHARHHSPDKATAAMLRAAETGRQALTDMRRSLGLLRTDEPDAQRHPLPGIAELADLADRMRAAGLPTRVDVRGEPARLPATVQLTVHRLVQEALTNTFKHAPAGTRAEVRIRCTATAVTVDVTDDNPGPPPSSGHGAPGHETPGHGIAGMRERVAAHGGTLRAGPLPGGGWAVRVRLRLDGVPAASA